MNRRLVTLALLPLLAVGTASPALAQASSAPAKAPGVEAPATPKKPVVRRAVTLTGVVTAVTAEGVELTTKRGSKRAALVRTVTVPETAIVRKDGVTATLADVEVGDRASVRATVAGTGFVASRVNASTPEPAEVPAEAPAPVVPPAA